MITTELFFPRRQSEHVSTFPVLFNIRVFCLPFCARTRLEVELNLTWRARATEFSRDYNRLLRLRGDCNGQWPESESRSYTTES